MHGIITKLQSRAREAARATAFGVVGAIFGMVGLGFLTVALWMLIATHYGAMVAFSVLGGLYVILALAFFAIGSRDPRASAHAESPSTPDPADARQPPEMVFAEIAEGFVLGLQAGRDARAPKANGHDRGV